MATSATSLGRCGSSWNSPTRTCGVPITAGRANAWYPRCARVTTLTSTVWQAFIGSEPLGGTSSRGYIPEEGGLGSRFADDFLGLIHDLSRVNEGVVRFWPRERLAKRVSEAHALAVSQGVMSPGTAAKVYGRLNFLESGMWGKIGRPGLNAIKDRANERERS